MIKRFEFVCAKRPHGIMIKQYSPMDCKWNASTQSRDIKVSFSLFWLSNNRFERRSKHEFGVGWI